MQKVVAGILIFSSLFKIKMKDFQTERSEVVLRKY